MAASLEVERVDLHYGAAIALRRVSVQVETGRVTCLMGRNGVGKTTLMKNIMGLLSHSAGDIMLGDQNVGGLPANRRARALVAGICYCLGGPCLLAVGVAGAE